MTLPSTTSPRPRPRHRVLRWLYRFLFAISLIIVVAYTAFAIAFQAPTIPRNTLSDPKPTENLTGDRPDLSQEADGKVRRDQCYTFLLAASDDGNGNADTIMVMTYDVPAKKIGLISIPRDTLVNKRYPKINATFASGVENLRDTVSDLVGFPLDFYIMVDLKAFVALVDEVGGVEFYVPCDMDYDDPTPGKELHIHYTEGTYFLNGKKAMEVVRFRHNNDGSGYTDVGRGETQRNLLAALADKVISWSSITKVSSFLDIFSTYADTDLTLSNLGYFAGQALSLDTKTDISSATLPGDGTVSCRGVGWCYQLYPEQTLELINTHVNPYTEPLKLSDLNIYQVR